MPSLGLVESFPLFFAEFFMTRTISIFVFDDVELLDLAGPYEVFTCASRVHARMNPGAEAPFKVLTIGQSAAPTRARAGLGVLPDASFTSHAGIDVLVIPGGVVTAELGKAKVIEWIAKAAASSELITSVCTGAFLLAQAGLLTGKQATTHWEDMDDLQTMFPEVQVQPQRRWVRDGNIVTSGGISAGIDMSLHLVETLVSRELALRTARQMEYAWNENA
jgi:transcriptional regulator GlxA family with amidase domain